MEPLILNIGCADRPFDNCVNIDKFPLALFPEAPTGMIAPYIIPADAVHLPFKSSIFDTILCFDVWEHIEGKEIIAAVLEIGRVLKVNGELLLTFPCLRVLSDAWKSLNVYDKMHLMGAYLGQMTSIGQTHKMILDWDIATFIFNVTKIWGNPEYHYSPPPSWWQCNMKVRKIYEQKDVGGIGCYQPAPDYGKMYSKYIKDRGPNAFYVDSGGQWIYRADAGDATKVQEGV